jgi:hypothetical protein
MGTEAAASEDGARRGAGPSIGVGAGAGASERIASAGCALPKLDGSIKVDVANPR